ncbi:hypothetical protein ACFV3R_12325 [Streptomyces sp. NPDC059740]|uniref:hypothetical protein n=1 Tax=Streptomyces sp. NPDC059740 TaxID=3346926 RepID=UPI00365BD03F
MTPTDIPTALAVATALRVFAPDLRRLTRRALREGVRAGAAALVEEGRRRPPGRRGPLASAVRKEES